MENDLKNRISQLEQEYLKLEQDYIILSYLLSSKNSYQNNSYNDSQNNIKKKYAKTRAQTRAETKARRRPRQTRRQSIGRQRRQTSSQRTRAQRARRRRDRQAREELEDEIGEDEEMPRRSNKFFCGKESNFLLPEDDEYWEQRGGVKPGRLGSRSECFGLGLFIGQRNPLPLDQ